MFDYDDCLLDADCSAADCNPFFAFPPETPEQKAAKREADIKEARKSETERIVRNMNDAKLQVSLFFSVKNEGRKERLDVKSVTQAVKAVGNPLIEVELSGEGAKNFYGQDSMEISYKSEPWNDGELRYTVKFKNYTLIHDGEVIVTVKINGEVVKHEAIGCVEQVETFDYFGEKLPLNYPCKLRDLKYNTAYKSYRD